MQQALPGAARPAVRLLHAGDDHGHDRLLQQNPRPPERRDPPRRSTATSAAAPATRTSSRPCRRPPSGRQRRLPKEGAWAADGPTRRAEVEQPPAAEGSARASCARRTPRSSPARAATSTTSSCPGCSTSRSCAARSRTPISASTRRAARGDARRRRACSRPTTSATRRPASRAARTRPAREASPRRPLLAEGSVRMVGEPVAVVVAERATPPPTPPPRRRRLRPAAGRRRRRATRSRPARRSCTTTRPDEPLLHDRRTRPTASTRRSRARRRSSASGSQPAPDARCRSRRAAASPTRIAVDRRGDALHSTQVPHFVQDVRRVVDGTSESKVRVIAPDVGGGFGSKLNIYAEEFAAVAALERARRAGEVDRGPQREHRSRRSTAATSQQSSWRSRSRTARSSALQLNIVAEHRRLPAAARRRAIPHLTLFMVPGLYDIPHDLDHDRPASSRTRRRPTPTAAPGRPGGRARRRADGRRARRRARARPGRGAAAELHPERVPVHDRGRPRPTTPATTSRPLDRALELVGLRRAARRARRRRAAAAGAAAASASPTYVEVCGLAPSPSRRRSASRRPAGSASTVRCTRSARSP